MRLVARALADQYEENGDVVTRAELDFAWACGVTEEIDVVEATRRIIIAYNEFMGHASRL